MIFGSRSWGGVSTPRRATSPARRGRTPVETLEPRRLFAGSVVINEIHHDPYLPAGAAAQPAQSVAPAAAPALAIHYRAGDYNPATGAWPDAAPLGGSQNATQGIASWRPVLVPNGAGSGRAVVRFDGFDDYLGLPNLSAAFPRGAEVFVAIRATRDPASDLANSGLWHLGGSGAANSHYPWIDGHVYDAFGTTVRADQVGAAAFGALGELNVYNVTSAPGEWTARLNNLTSASRNVNTVEFPTSPRIGQSRDAFHFAGDIAELRLYDLSAGPLTQADRDAIHGELSRAYVPQGVPAEFVELHNPGDAPVNLGGARFTAGVEYTFPANTVLPAGGYLVVADDPAAVGDGYGITGVLGPWVGRLDNAGERLTLRDAGGNVLDDVDFGQGDRWPEVGTGRLRASMELVRPQVDNNVGAHWRADGPSPGRRNDAYDASFLGVVADTEFDRDRGFYSAPFDVTITTATPAATIVYTTNGTEPTPSNGVVVNASTAVVRVSTTTVLRAAAFKTNYQPSNIDTQTYVFPAAVPNQPRPPGVGPTWPGGYPADFDINAGVVAAANNRPGYTFGDALAGIPSMSIVTPPDGLWDPSTGMYANAQSDIERASSVEMIFPDDGSRNWQENAGAHIRGNSSETKAMTPKHSFNVVFRRQYGAGKLDHPGLLEGNDADEFNAFALRGNVLDSWVNSETAFNMNIDGELRWYRERAGYVRDQWVRDTQIDMGKPAADGRFVHLYLNGSYWGIYNLIERLDEQWAEEHFGGEAADYDVVHDNELKAGNMNAWTQIMDQVRGAADNATYQRLRGNNPDGTRNPAYPVLLDVENLVDYMILHIFAGADDWSWHNWSAVRDRTDSSTGWKWLAWDQEISINSLVKQHTASGPLYAETSDIGPCYVYAQLRNNPEFRQLFADRVQHHMFNGGPLSVGANIARYEKRMAEIDQAIVAESARWGDFYRPEQPYTRETEWLTNRAWMRDTFFPQNHANALTRFRNANLFPSLAAPAFGRHGGAVADNYPLTITNPGGAGTLYYTTDGSDPRLTGGGLSPAVQVYSGPVTLSGTVQVKARVLHAGQWSALTAAVFSAGTGGLRVTELNYHPAPFGTTYGEEEFEFVELKNFGSRTIDLAGAAFTGVTFTFGAGASLAPGQVGVVVRNADAFRSRYGTAPLVLGSYGASITNLANGGERVAITDRYGQTLADFTYDDTWHPITDGGGPTLEVIDPAPGPDLSSAASWRPSSAAGGTPGTTGGGPPAAQVAGRHVFYNRSAYDGNDPLPTAADDAAVDAAKAALLPGQAASAANVTAYSRGVNGVMVDVANPPPNAASNIGLDDVSVRTTTPAAPDAWSAGPAPSSVTVRPGPGGAARVTLLWPDGVVANRWLEVTLLGNADTGLAAADVFRFGSLVGDADASRTVNLADFGALRSDFGRTGLGVADGRSDFNRDGTVNLADFGLLRANFGKSLAALTAPAAAADPAPAAAGQPDKRRARPGAASLLLDAETHPR